MMKQFQAPLPDQPGAPAGADAMDTSGAGGGTIGVGQAPVPGEQGFSGNAQQQGTNTQQAEAVVGNNRQWQAFNDYLDCMINQQQKALEQADHSVLDSSDHRVPLLRLRKLKVS